MYSWIMGEPLSLSVCVSVQGAASEVGEAEGN